VPGGFPPTSKKANKDVRVAQAAPNKAHEKRDLRPAASEWIARGFMLLVTTVIHENNNFQKLPLIMGVSVNWLS
jgi:hypothetical protein